MSDKGLVTKLHKEFLKLNNKEINSLRKYGQNILIGTSPKKIY